MHNGCLLLLAFVAVFQPIASYSERGLVDGRQQRCDYRTSVRDPGLNFHGTYRFNKPAVENRRLNHREDTREVRRNEVREESLRIASSAGRRLADTSERDRNTLTRISRDRIGNYAVLRRENLETRLVSSRRDERNQGIRRERLSRVQETHQARLDSRRENSRFSEDENRSQRIDNRVSVESRRDIRGNAISEATQRVRQHREVRVEINRVRDNGASSLNDRRIARETIERMDTPRSVPRVQRDRNVDRETVGRRSSRELRSLSTSNILHYDDSTSLDRNDRRISSSQRLVNEQRQRDSRIRLTVERRNIRDAVSRRVLDDRTSVNRRDVQRIQRARSIDNQNTEYKTRLARAVRSVDNIDSQNDRSDSRIMSREMAAENRRSLIDARNMVRTRSLQRSGEYRNDFRSSDRVLENRADNRNIEREPRTNINIIRVAETRNSNTDTCVYEREPSAEHRMTIMIRERSHEHRRLARNIESRASRTERTGEGRRSVSEAATQAIRTESIDERVREARNIELRAFINERADQSRRDARTVAAAATVRVRSLRTERFDESQRDTRNIAVRVLRSARTDQSSRDAREVALRSFRAERSVESRRDDARNINSRKFRDERTGESRGNAREVRIRAFRTERTDKSRQDARNVEARPFRTEHKEENRYVDVRASRTVRADKSHRDARNVDVRAFRTERTDESRRDARNVEVRASRTVRNDESRINAREVGIRAFRSESALRGSRNIEARATESATRLHKTRGVERQSRSLDRVTDSRRDRENNNRNAHIHERALESRNVQNIESRSESERADKRRAVRSLEREIRSMGRERSIESRLREKPNRDSRMSTMERRSDRRERTTENRRNVQNVHKDIRSLDAQERGVETRRMNLVRSGDIRRDTQRTSERSNLARRQETESRHSFDTGIARNQEFQNLFKNPAETENEQPTMNWQHVFYALQGLYICGLLMQLNKGSVEKKTRVSWWPAPQHLIKVD